MRFLNICRKISGGACGAFQCIAAIALFGCFCATAAAEGKYQPSKDGKTLVWNQEPRPGDAATWSGSRDESRYATGFGTLTWYSSRKKGAGAEKETVYATFFGNMVRGKLDGPVNGHSKGVTNHALFSEGKRITRWAAGPTPSWTIPRPEKETPAEEIIVARTEQTKPVEFNPPPPAYQASSSRRPTPNYDAVRQQTESAAPDVPAEGPVSQEKKAAAPPPDNVPQVNNPKLEIDASLRSLAGPPPSLGSESNAAKRAPEQKQSGNGASPVIRLTKDEVIALADAAARQKGYDPSRYQRPDPAFDSVDSTWSVFYAPIGGSPAADTNRLTVAVDDNTKRTAVVGGR